MKSKDMIKRVLVGIDCNKSKFPGMTYEQGIEVALSWVLEFIEDEEFLPQLEVKEKT